jgi:hypothetical protein
MGKVLLKAQNLLADPNVPQKAKATFSELLRALAKP